MQDPKKAELSRLKRRAREALKKIAQIISQLEMPAFDLGYADGKMAAMLNLPYKPPDIIKADRHTEHQYWRGWSCGRETAIKLEIPAFDLGYADGKMAAISNLPYKPPDIIKADRHTEHQYWHGWSCGRETAIKEGYKPTIRLPNPPIQYQAEAS